MPGLRFGVSLVRLHNDPNTCRNELWSFDALLYGIPDGVIQEPFVYSWISLATPKTTICEPEVLNPSKKKTPNYVIDPIIREHVWPYYKTKMNRFPKLSSWTANRQRMGITCFREALLLAEAKWNVAQAVQLMLRAIDNLTASDFHIGLNPKTGGEKYNNWEHVFGTLDKFKKWIGVK